MITFLNGILVEKQPTRVVLDVGGVGYEILVPLSTFERLPTEAKLCRLVIHDYVREDQHTLYGFGTEAERSMFNLLLAVNGVGPKTALSVLSGLSARQLNAAVVENDLKRLCSIPGIGKKTAERIVLELRHKIDAASALEATSGTEGLTPEDMKARDAVLALVSLGYKQLDARKMVNTVVGSGKIHGNVEDIIRDALAKHAGD